MKLLIFPIHHLRSIQHCWLILTIRLLTKVSYRRPKLHRKQYERMENHFLFIYLRKIWLFHKRLLVIMQLFIQQSPYQTIPIVKRMLNHLLGLCMKILMLWWIRRILLLFLMLVRRLYRLLHLILRNNKSYHHNRFKLNLSLIKSLRPII